jgi:glycine cleavage system aminomethyltransferase T
MRPTDFIGKDALIKVRAQGITRKLIGIRILGDALPAPFEERWPVLIDGVPAGEVTVAVYSPRPQMNIGYAMVPIGSAAPDTRLDIEAPWGRASAIVNAMPFIKRR